MIATILLMAIVAACGCGRAKEAPAADARNSVRIASLSPAISIIAEDLGLAGFIVGRHGSDQSLDSSMPVVGDQSGIDYETLARLEPTHVLFQESADGPPALLLEIADRRGWNVISIPLLSLDEVAQGVQTLAATFADVGDVEKRARELRHRMHGAWAARPDLSRRAGSTLCVYWVSPIGVAGPGSFHHDLLIRMGIDALPVEGSAYITLDREDLKRLNPDSILILTPDIEASSLDDALAPWRGLGVSAIEHNRIAVLSDWSFLTPSTAMIDLADRIAAVIEAWPTPAGSKAAAPTSK